MKQKHLHKHLPENEKPPEPAADKPETTTVKEHAGVKGGRKPLDENQHRYRFLKEGPTAL
jgi:hypothetical protein